MVLGLSTFYKLLLNEYLVTLKDEIDSKVKDELSKIYKELGIVGNTEKLVPFGMLSDDKLSVDNSQFDINILNLRKILWSEERIKDLQEIPSDFYIKAIIFLRVSKNKEEVRKIRNLLLDILRRRTQKIVKYAQYSPSPSRDILKKMAFEERVLYISLCNTIQKWEKTIIREMEGAPSE